MNSNIDGNDKFKDWGDQWFRRKKLDFSLSYAKTALNHLKNINSFIGDIPISNIKIQDIDEFIIEFAEKNPHTGHPTAKSTLKDMRNIAASVFDFACDYEAIYKNPARGRKIPKKAPKTIRRALTKTEQKWIIETQHRMRLCALSMMLCGPRLGEIIPLTWYDLDFNTRLWTINKSVERLGNKYNVKPDTKNHKSRCVKAPVEIMEEFKIARSNANSKYVFCQINGEMHTIII